MHHNPSPAHLDSFNHFVTPRHAWTQIAKGQALLVDVRSQEEWMFVGHIPHSVLIPWATGPKLVSNPDFLNALAKVSCDGRPLYLLCRSGKRSEQAARQAHEAGLNHVYSVLEGFEGDINAHGHRGKINGWKYHGLPWVQD